MRLSILPVVLGLVWSAPKAEAAHDACGAAIPLLVARALTQRLPDYRLPLVTDSGDEDVQFSVEHAGTRCQLVTSGDFDGDGVKDFAVGLIRKDGKQPIVAVALARNGTWLISALKSWVDDPIRLYVKTVPSGIHRRTEASNIGPLAPTERELLRCNHPAVIVGATESTGVVYCYISKRWLYVWVSD